MNHPNKFKDKLSQSGFCLGTCISFSDPTVTEALTTVFDFLWIDAEHSPMSLETLQGHVMATKGTETIPLIRVPWNDPVLIKPILDIGAAGVIVPFVRSADDVQRAVAACRYPPEGIRGYGPRRPSNYGRLGGPSFCEEANSAVTVIVQIEHVEAVSQIEEILAVSGLSSIVVGPNDLSGSMGHMGNPSHPEVLRTIETVISKARAAEVIVGICIGDDPERVIEWVDKGVQWVAMGGDFTLMLRAADQVSRRVRSHVAMTKRAG